MFITLEGVEGSGKTTLAKGLEKALMLRGHEVLVTHEPGGGKISEAIREIILDPENEQLDTGAEALLYAAARKQHISEIIQPALAKGQIVICDQFTDSSIAYQGYGRGLDLKGLESINNFATNGLIPNLTLFIDVEPAVGLDRIKKNGTREVNRLDLETTQFHERVYNGYLEQAKKTPERIQIIDGHENLSEMVQSAFNHIEYHLSIKKELQEIQIDEIKKKHTLFERNIENLKGGDVEKKKHIMGQIESVIMDDMILRPELFRNIHFADETSPQKNNGVTFSGGNYLGYFTCHQDLNEIHWNFNRKPDQLNLNQPYDEFKQKALSCYKGYHEIKDGLEKQFEVKKKTEMRDRFIIEKMMGIEL